MTISIEAEKAFDKIQHCFMDKNSPESENRRNIPQHNKATYDKPTANIILNGEKLKAFPLRLRTKQGCALSSLLFNIVLAVLAMAIREEKEIKGIQIRKETLVKEIKDDTSRWKDIPWSWIGRINIVKITILSKAIYRFNAIPIKLSMAFFTELKQKVLRLVWSNKRH